MSYTAIVLAGSRPGRDAFAEQFGTDLKALIPVGGEPMAARPVKALLQSKSIETVIVLSQAPDRLAAVLPADPRLKSAASGTTIASTMLALCNDPGTRWPILVTTGDHALLDSVTVEEFCAGAAGSDLAVGVVEKNSLLQRLPATRRTWLNFRGGSFTGANLFALASPKVAPAINLWRSVEQDRKKGWKLVALLGPVTLLGAALRLLTIDVVLGQLGRKLGLRVRAVTLSNPIAGVDVDKAEDHALAEDIIAGRA